MDDLGVFPWFLGWHPYKMHKIQYVLRYWPCIKRLLCVEHQDATPKGQEIMLLMEEIWRSPVEVGTLSHYLRSFWHPRWLGMGFFPSVWCLLIDMLPKYWVNLHPKNLIGLKNRSRLEGAPRMPVVNKGLVGGSLLKWFIILVVTGILGRG